MRHLLIIYSVELVIYFERWVGLLFFVTNVGFNFNINLIIDFFFLQDKFRWWFPFSWYPFFFFLLGKVLPLRLHCNLKVLQRRRVEGTYLELTDFCYYVEELCTGSTKKYQSYYWVITKAIDAVRANNRLCHHKT